MIPRYANSVLVQPAWTIVSSSAANPTVLETSTPHYFVSGDTVTLAGHSGATPALTGTYIVTVIDATHFSIPVPVTTGGTGGTVTRTIPREPLTLEEGLLRAGFTWAPGDEREPLMLGWIATARQVVEQRTQLALLSQVRDCYYDVGPLNPLPPQSTPLQAVLAVTQVNGDGTTTTVPPDQYRLDTVNGRILGLTPAVPQSWNVRLVSGWPSPEAIPPALLHAVGLLTAHYATIGRDMVSIDPYPSVEVPFGFEDAIAPYTLVTLG